MSIYNKPGAPLLPQWPDKPSLQIQERHDLNDRLAAEKIKLTVILNKYHLTYTELVSAAKWDWNTIKKDMTQVEALADAVYKAKLMKEGKIPYDYTVNVVCQNCGEVKVPPSLSSRDPLLGCPWCYYKKSHENKEQHSS